MKPVIPLRSLITRRRLTVVLIAGAFCLSSCITRVISTRVDPKGDNLVEGIPYYLPSSLLKIEAVYTVVGVWDAKDDGTKDGGIKEIKAAPQADKWKVTVLTQSDSDLVFSIDPSKFRHFWSALPGGGSDSANNIELDPKGYLKAFNFKAEDKTAEILKNLIKTGVNIAKLSTGPMGLMAKSSGRQVTEVLGEVPATITVPLQDLVDRAHASALTHVLSELDSIVRNSSVIAKHLNLEVTKGEVNIEQSTLSFSAKGLAFASKQRATLAAQGAWKGVVGRYKGPATLSINVQSGGGTAVEFLSAAETFFEAGGFHVVPITSHPFTTSTDNLTFTDGAVTKYSYGRESTGEKVSAAALSLSGEVNTAVTDYDKAKRASIVANTDLQKAVVEASANVESAKLKVELAQQAQDAAQTKLNAEGDPIERAALEATLAEKKQAVVLAKKELAVAEIELDKAKKLAST